MRLHSIPEALISTVFSQWLTMVDIARVDSAFCSKHQRPRLLQTAYSPGVVLQYTDDSGCKHNDALNKWIVTRGASVPCIYVTDFLHNAQPRKSYLERHGKTIHSAAIHPLTRQTWTSCKAAILDFVRYCPSLTKIGGASSLDCLGWLYIADRCPLLEEISNVHITPFSMAILARKSPLLRKVQFASDANVTDELMSALCVNAPKFEHFVHNDCASRRLVTDNSMITMATHCRHLMTLDVDGRCLTDASIYALAEHCKQLYALCLRESDVSGQALAELTSVCSLRKLAFHGLTNLRPKDLNLILVNCPNLHSFTLRPSVHRHAYTCGNIGRTCPQLQELALLHYYSIAACLHNLSDCCPDLRKFTVTSHAQCTQEVVHEVVRCCPNLTHLEYSSSSADDAFLHFVVKHCLALRVLTTRGSARITDAGILAVARALPHLRKLNLGEARWGITDEGLAAVAAARPRLRARISHREYDLGEVVPADRW